jgi:cyclopropane fatty-acyl-phospholipid synthase-like methyltransferase
MDRLPVDVHDKRVMEFGCGLGGNLLAVSENIRYGVGVDVNRGFLRIAAQLCRKAGVRNLSFIWYDGKTLPPLGLFELVFSIGVFERLPKEQVRSYVEHLKKVLVPEGKLVLYFLTDSAKNSDFSRRLGPESYVYWSEDQLRGLFGDCHMRVEATHDWSPYSVIYVVQ